MTIDNDIVRTLAQKAESVFPKPDAKAQELGVGTNASDGERLLAGALVVLSERIEALRISYLKKESGSGGSAG